MKCNCGFVKGLHFHALHIPTFMEDLYYMGRVFLMYCLSLYAMKVDVRKYREETTLQNDFNHLIKALLNTLRSDIKQGIDTTEYS